MNKYLKLSLILLLIYSCSTNEVKEPVDCVNMVYKEGMAYFEDQVFSGSCIVYTGDKKMNQLLSFKRGAPSGVHEGYYYPGEELEFRGNRKRGEIHGDYQRYHLNGELHMSGKLKKGFRVGLWSIYDNKGKLLEERKYFNGKIIDSTTYINE